MPAGSFTHSQVENYRANLMALGEWRPELAEALEAQAIPASVEAATGRDGSETFRIRRADGSSQWFGRSSMPTISAPALIGGFRSDGRNVILPTIGTGREVLIIEQRLPAHCAVFVWEQDPLALKLALHLHDLSRAIGRCRLVLLCADDVATALADLFAAHPGFEFPQHLLPLPMLADSQREQTRVLLESAASRVAQGQWTLASELGTRLKGHRRSAPSEPPRVAVLSRDPRTGTIELANQLGAALGQLGWPPALGVPDRPDRCHTVARLAEVRRHGPDLVLLLNCVKGPLADYLPDDLPVCSWLITADSVAGAGNEGLENNAAVFAARPDIAEGLLAAGAKADAVHLLEEATDPATFSPTAVDPAQQQQVECQVAVFSDAVNLSAAAAGITQVSHVRLWEHLCEGVARSAGNWHSRMAAKVLEQAERKSGTRLTEPAVRERFLALVRSHLSPTVLTRSAIERLALARVRVAIWGSGWESHASTKGLVRGPVPNAVGRATIYHSAGLVLCPLFHDRTARTMLDCLAAGGCPVYLRPERPIEELHPQLGEVLAAVPSAASLDELAAVVKRLAGNPEARREATAKARDMVLERHTLAHRLRAIGQRVLGL